MNTITRPIYYTPKEVSEILDVHYHTVLEWIDKDKIKYKKFGNLYKIPANAI